MPIELKDADKGLGVLITGSGIVTEEEYVHNFTRHLTQKRDKFRSYRYSLDDWTAVTHVEVPTEAIAQIAQLCDEAQKINPDVVVAHVADKNITFGLSRMWEMLLQRRAWETMVFKTRDASETWIRQKVKEKFGIENLTFG